MSIKKIVWIKTSFEGFHRWINAPDDVAFLRDYHRHIFEVKLGVEVSDGDREVEFFQLKRKVESFILDEFEGHWFEFSCEQIAEFLLNKFDACFVEISEDGENGATISKE